MGSQRGVQVASILNNDTALWEGGENGTHRLNMRAFEMIFPSCPFFPLASEDVFVSGGSKTSIEVMMEPLTLVRNLMHPVKWRNFFPCIIAADEPSYVANQPYAAIEPETVHETIEIQASFQVLSPLVPIKESRFIRTCCKVRIPTGSYEWLVFDLPTEDLPRQLTYVRACLVKNSDVAGASLVTWMELAQYERHIFPNEYHGMLGSVRWAESLARECRRPSIYSFATEDFREKQLTVLAPRMTRKFCLGIASSTRDPYVRMGVSIGFTHMEDSDNYMTAARTERVNGTFGEVFGFIHSQLPPLAHFGQRIVHVPSHHLHNYVGVYVHNGDPNKRFMRQSIVDPSGATFVTAPIATRVLIKKTLTQNDEDMVFESIGYALFPDGNTGRTILTVASQSNVDPNLTQDDVQGNAGLMDRAAAAINAAITEITNHFPA